MRHACDRKSLSTVKIDEMGFLKDSKELKVPRSSVKRRVKGKNKKVVENKEVLGCDVQLLVQSKKKNWSNTFQK